MVSVVMPAPTDTSGFTSNELRIVGLTSLGHTLCHVGELAFPAVIGAVVSEFNIDVATAALLAVPGFVLYGVGAIPAGLLTDRCGTRKMMTVYFFLLAVSAALVCTSNSPLTLCITLTLLGLAISIYHPAGLAMLSHGCRNRGRAMGANGVAGSLGVALGPAIGLSMVQLGSWRLAYALIATIGLIAGVASSRIRIDTETPATKSTVAKTSPSVSKNLVAIVGVLFVAMTFGGFNYRSLMTALPTFLDEQYQSIRGPGESYTAVGLGADSSNGLSTEQPGAGQDGTPTRPGKSGWVVFLVLALGGVGQYFGGVFADRYQPSLLYPISILATVPFALVMSHGSEVGSLAGVCGLVVFMFSMQPVENIMIAQVTPAHWRSTVYGLKFILTFGIAAFGAYACGLVWKNVGIHRVFDMFAVVAVLMGTLAMLFRWLQPRLHSAMA